MNFQPEDITFQEGLQRIGAARQKTRVSQEDRILTSRDPGISDMREDLRVSGLPEGFEMWQLPVTVGRTLQFIGVAAPRARMPAHRHNQPVLRVILSGSITYEGKELTAGDWMYIPAGKEYSFQAGHLGATFLYPHAARD